MHVVRREANDAEFHKSSLATRRDCWFNRREMHADAKLVAFLATGDAARARRSFEGVLGLAVVEDQPYALVLQHGGVTIRVQKVEAVQPAPYTALGWQVADIEAEVTALDPDGNTLSLTG